MPREEAIKTEYKQISHTICLRTDGVTLVRGVFRYPRLEPRDLYGELAQNAEDWLRTVLLPRVTEEYRQDPSPRKCFTFPFYEYRFEAQTVSTAENEITVSLRVTLARKNSRDTIASREITDRLRLPDLAPLPPKRKKHRH
ncbi:MAG: hypothetical protein J6D16_04290 [Clostridia bacterium]|nr:hypothetical protein [Clostridia bacterium]